MARHRLDVNRAAEVLGISTDAVRKRARRGTLASEKDADGHLYVWLDDVDGGTPNGTPDGLTPTRAHLDSLQEEVAFLRRELERKDAILLNMTEALRALNPPAPPEPRDAPETATGEPDRSESRPATGGAQEAARRRPWWRRLLRG